MHGQASLEVNIDGLVRWQSDTISSRRCYFLRSVNIRKKGRMDVGVMP